jgi:transcriptional regulator with XRE-family HTH domain
MDFPSLLTEMVGDCGSQVELAEATGLGQSTISMLLTGERKPGPKVIRRLAAAFPERRKQLWSLFLSSSDYNKDEIITNVND